MTTPNEGGNFYSHPDAPKASTSQGVSPEVRLNPSTSKVVGNQAKKQEEAVTRQGTQRMKFVPTLPLRRKKPDDEVKKEEAPAPKPIERGRSRGRSIGRGRGAPPSRQEMTMVASGPFAMGPAMGGAAKKRVPRSSFTPAMPLGGTPASIGDGITRPVAAPLDKSMRNKVEDDADTEVYSDPDEGVQIVDMDAVRTMDWMAPESLRRHWDNGQKPKKTAEALKKIEKGKQKAKENLQAEVGIEVAKDNANALDLSDSEEEEEMEDLIEDFAMDNFDIEEEENLTRQEKLYFFQFPQPFPTFAVPTAGEDVNFDSILVDEKKPLVSEKGAIADREKKVSFASDVKGPGADDSIVAPVTDEQDLSITADTKIDGIIGQLEVHRSGAIKMRLNNGIVMDVTAATQPSFLQHAVYINPTAKKLHVLGEVNRRFVVSPDVDKLLQEVEKAERVKAEEAAEVSMTTLSK